MEIEYQYTKADFIEFNKLYFRDGLNRRLWVVIVLILLAVFSFSGKPFEWPKFLIGTSVSVIVIFGIYYFIPLWISFIRWNKALAKDQSALEKRKLTVIDAGLLIESESITTTRKWESIVSAHSNDKFIYLVLADKKILLFPKKAFPSESDAINFLGLIQSKVIKVRGVTPKFQISNVIKKPNYRLGFLCLIPVVGAIAGIIFIADGISKYKDKRYILMGFGGIVFNVCIFLFVFYYLNLGKEMQRGLIPSTRMQLNSLMKDVEFYKIKNGVYPDSLEQVSKENPMAWIDDPLQSNWSNNSFKFNYQKVGNHYYLFSSGIDGIPNTKDDIYPQVAASDSSKFGLIRKSY